MPDIIANFASFGKPKHCDFQRYSDLAISASFPRMEVIDGQWISARLSGRHGEKAKLAAAIGISPHKLAKILSGERKVQAEEIPKVMTHFGAAPDDALSAQEKHLIEVLRRLLGPERAAIVAAAEALDVHGPREGK